MSPDEVAALVERYLDRHARCDLEGVMALFASDTVLEDPVGSDPHRGHAAIRAFYREIHERGVHLDIERLGPVICRGGEAAAHVRARYAKPPDSPRVDVIYTLTVDEAGLLRSLRAYF